MHVNLHHLQLFYYVAKAKGISPAIKIIPYGIQQPAISQQIIQLEEALDFRLFERRPFALTVQGESVYKFISRFFDNLDAEIGNIKDEAGVRIRFGCPSIISANYLPLLIKKLLERFPNTRPHICELNGDAVFAALINREIDIAISFGNIPKSKAVTVKKLVSLPMSLILSKGHRFLKEGFWAKSDFASEKWIAIQEETGGTQELREGLSQFGIVPDFIASTSSIEAAIQYVEMGLGSALMARPPLPLTQNKAVEIMELSDIFGSINLTIAWHNETTLDKKSIDFILQTAKDLSAEFVR